MTAKTRRIIGLCSLIGAFVVIAGFALTMLFAPAHAKLWGWPFAACVLGGAAVMMWPDK